MPRRAAQDSFFSSLSFLFLSGVFRDVQSGMDESKRRVVKFLKKEIKTYTALSLFLSKNSIRHRARGDVNCPVC